VFVGGCTVEAAETVCSGDGLAPEDVLEGLFRLVDRSLVVAAGGVPARFAMLETLRDYGAERLAEAGETHALEARHTAWFLDLAERAAVHRTARRWLRLLDADYDNLRAVLDRAVAGRDLDTALRLAGALGWYWSTNRNIEGRQRLAGVAALADGRPPTHALARVLQAAAMAEVQQTPTAGTVAAARRSQELFERFGDRQGAAFSKLLRGWATQQLRGPGGDLIRLAAEAEATFTELGDRWGEAFAAHSRFAFEINSQGLSQRTEEAARLALARFQALDDQWGMAQAQFSLAQVARMRGDIGGAIAACERALAAARDGGPLWVMLASLSELGGLVGLQGDDARAAALQSEAAALFRRTGLRRGFAHLYNEVGAIARMRGDLERARQLHQEALSIVRELLGWSVPFTIAQLACAEARLGDLDDAEAHLREAAGLLLAAPDPDAETAPLVLVGAALVAVGRERPEQAARLLAAAETTRERTGVAATGAEAHEADLAGRAVRSALDPDALAAAEAGGRALATGAALRELVASA
jgi:tetratricopeptide (TPR) repeat protein